MTAAGTTSAIEERSVQSCADKECLPSGRSWRMDRALAGQMANRRERDERVRALRRAACFTIAVGALHALLFLLSYWLMSDVPGPRASDEQIATFYQSSARRRPILVGLYLMPFAGIAFIWFVVALRMWV